MPQHLKLIAQKKKKIKGNIANKVKYCDQEERKLRIIL